jgi:mRNA interferase MazF
VKRGDLAIVAAPGDYGQPRPAVIVQSDELKHVDSVMVALISTHRIDAPLYRLSIAPEAKTGLKDPSDIMVEKVLASPRRRIGPVIGRLCDADLLVLNRMLAFALGLADLPATVRGEP